MQEETQGEDRDHGEEVAAILENDQLSEADRVKALNDLGFSRKQLIEEFNFSRSLVYRVLPVKQEEGQDRADNMKMPVVVKGTEIITPEAIMHSLVDGSRDWELRLEGMMLLRAAQRMVMDDVQIMREQAKAEAELLKPVLEVMKEARAEQDAAAERARGSVAEAAQEAAARLAGHFDQRLSHLEDRAGAGEASHPMEGMFTRVMEPMLKNMVNRMFGGGQQAPAQREPLSGWTEKEITE